MLPIALTIAGSDPSGGAGIQADLKTFHRFEVYGEAVVTLVTVQNTMPAQGYSPEGPVMCVPLSSAEVQADAARLAQQATFGPTDALVLHIQNSTP